MCYNQILYLLCDITHDRSIDDYMARYERYLHSNRELSDISKAVK